MFEIFCQAFVCIPVYQQTWRNVLCETIPFDVALKHLSASIARFTQVKSAVLLQADFICSVTSFPCYNIYRPFTISDGIGSAPRGEVRNSDQRDRQEVPDVI